MDTVVEIEGIHFDERPDNLDAPDFDPALSDLYGGSFELEGQLQEMRLSPYAWQQLVTQQFQVKLLPWFLGEWRGEGWVEALEVDDDEACLSMALRPDTVEFSQPTGLGARLLRLLWGIGFLRPILRKF